MSKENIVEIEEIMENEEEVTEIEVKETFGSKVKNGIQKHGKTILKGVGIAALAIGAYALGAKSKSNDCDNCEFTDVIDVEYEIPDSVDPE